MAHGILAAKNELLNIFPQHSEETITRIYQNVVENLGEDTHVLVLPVCIDRLLELPPPGNNVNNSINNTSTVKALGTNDIYSNRPQPPPLLYGQEGNPFGIIIPGINNDSDLSNDGFSSSSSDERPVETNEDYRNKSRPTYRERSRSRSFSPNDSLGGYLSDKDDQIFANLDDINFLEGFVAAPTIMSAPAVINIPDSPLANRKRKFENINEFDFGNHLVSGAESSIKKKDDINGVVKVPLEPDISTIRKGMVGYLESIKEQVKAVIVDVDNDYLGKIINEEGDGPVPQVVNNVVLRLIENKNYPKVAKYRPPSSTLPSKGTSTITFKYNQQSITLLQNGFPKVSTKVIRKVFYGCSNYTKAFETIENAFKSIISGEKRVEETIIVSLLKGCRSKIRIDDLCSTLSDEIESMDKKNKEEIEKGDRATAAALNTQQYDEEGQTIECECCYDEVTFEDMVQCLEGHLFCVTCLQRYSKEATYGSAKAQLFCMADGCGSTFPMSQMKKALEGALLEKFMERVQAEDIKLAQLDNLIQCPSCDFAAEMDDGDKVFRCQNTSCLKETCRYCKEDWKDHFGVPCKELEKKEETNLRTTYEEKMTQAKVRKCWQCSTIFLKEDGCNKMTCRCTAKMCYICRQPKINYDHFCQHPRNPGEDCSQCKKCNLWTDPSEDDDRAVAEIKKQAEEERMKLSGDTNISKISIGPTITVTTASNTSGLINGQMGRFPLRDAYIENNAFVPFHIRWQR